MAPAADDGLPDTASPPRVRLPVDALLARAGSDDVRGALGRAAARRSSLLRSGATDAVRLAHEEADDLPGWSIDLYGPFAVLSRYAERARASERELCDALLAMGVRGVYAKRRPRHASGLGEAGEAVAPSHAIAGEDAPATVEVVEHGRRQLVRLGDGLSTGLFVDLRDARSRVERDASGARFLNLFGYTGAYSVAAGLGGARSTATVDASRPALARAAENLALNGLPTPAPHRTYAEDALSFLARARVRGDKFDLAALDPPSFATTKGATFSVEEDYVSVAAATLSVLAAGGALVASTNHRGIDGRAFTGLLRAAAARAGRVVAAAETLPLPLDFPPLPRGPHLKVVRLALRG